MNFNQLLCVAVCACLAMPVWAHVESSTFRPESHAPAGVMSDHLHAKGEWMFGYRYLTSEYRGLYQGSSSITPEQAGAAGYSMVGRTMSIISDSKRGGSCNYCGEVHRCASFIAIQCLCS